MKRLLIANRGEIAVRIARTAERLGLETVAVYSDADADARHVRMTDIAVHIGGSQPAESYLSIDALLAAARSSGADAVHPGYGFLAESPEFAERCTAAGLTFVGPSAQAMRALGNKAGAKRLLADSGVPFLPGYHGDDQSDAALVRATGEIGMPLMIKAAAGGGGRGMRLVRSADGFGDALRAARSEALAAFGSADVLLERALFAPRHIEVQVFADTFGNAVSLGERDCSVQRRHQKLIEEAPSPGVGPALREQLAAAALTVVRATAYSGAATVEFLVDEAGAFYFIEVNTRLQVEHPVTEFITGLDLVEWQLRIARGEPLPRTQARITTHGHAIEARLCAEDPARGFLPQSGTLALWIRPSGVRVEHALTSGMTISPYYDSMIAKLIAYGTTREEARTGLVRGLATCVALGVTTNAAALIAYLNDPAFVAGAATTRFIDERADIAAATEPAPAIVALAAAIVFCNAADGGRFGPWTAWSSGQLPASAVRLTLDDGPCVTVGLAAQSALRVVAAAGGERFAIELSHASRSGELRVRIDDGPWRRLTLAFDAANFWFAYDGRSYAAIDRSAEPAAAAVSAGDGFVRAPMSGRIVLVAGGSGDVVAAGAPLVVVEAMKMEHTLTLPIDVVLREVTAVAGHQVRSNEILLAYEPALR